MILIIVIAGILGAAFLVLVVLVAIASHLEDRRASIRQRPTSRLISAVRRVTGLHVGNSAVPANEKEEVRA